MKQRFELRRRVHVVIENPLALADPAAAPRVFQRRRQEGLTRHEALHALGAVLAQYISNVVLQPGGETGDARGRYAAALKSLSADSWRQMFAGDEEGLSGASCSRAAVP